MSVHAQNLAAAASTTPRRARPARPPVPGLANMGALDHTHRRMLTMVLQLEALLELLANPGSQDAAKRSAKSIVSFFSSHARAHHAEEERLVFPTLLRRANAELTQHVLRLQQDHNWLEEDWMSLSGPLQAIAEGYNWYELDSLRPAVAVFAALLREHIALEETLVYPEAKRLLREEAEAQARRMAQVSERDGAPELAQPSTPPSA